MLLLAAGVAALIVTHLDGPEYLGPGSALLSTDGRTVIVMNREAVCADTSAAVTQSAQAVSILEQAIARNGPDCPTAFWPPTLAVRLSQPLGRPAAHRRDNGTPVAGIQRAR